MNGFVKHLMKRNRCSEMQAQALATKIFEEKRARQQLQKTQQLAPQLALPFEDPGQRVEEPPEDPLPF